MMWILIGGRCPTEEEKKFKRNPNLELFLSQEERSYFSPVFSPDGEKVYCIMRRWFSYHIKSLLVSISTDDKKINKIVEDSVVVFTLNHRGDEMLM